MRGKMRRINRTLGRTGFVVGVYCAVIAQRTMCPLLLRTGSDRA